jgi:hypothetical protein
MKKEDNVGLTQKAILENVNEMQKQWRYQHGKYFRFFC